MSNRSALQWFPKILMKFLAFPMISISKHPRYPNKSDTVTESNISRHAFVIFHENFIQIARTMAKLQNFGISMSVPNTTEVNVTYLCASFCQRINIFEYLLKILKTLKINVKMNELFLTAYTYIFKICFTTFIILSWGYYLTSICGRLICFFFFPS